MNTPNTVILELTDEHGNVISSIAPSRIYDFQYERMDGSYSGIRNDSRYERKDNGLYEELSMITRNHMPDLIIFRSQGEIDDFKVLKGFIEDNIGEKLTNLESLAVSEVDEQANLVWVNSKGTIEVVWEDNINYDKILITLLGERELALKIKMTYC